MEKRHQIDSKARSGSNAQRRGDTPPIAKSSIEIGSSEQIRADVVGYAMEYIDAAYRYGGQEPYKGSDCANLGIAPYQRAGLIGPEIRIPHQHRDWMFGRDVNPHIFREFILQFAEEVPFDSRQSADLVTFMFRGVESHVGIITQVNPDWFIHNPSGGAVKFQKLMQVGSLKSVYRHKKIIEMEAK